MEDEKKKNNGKLGALLLFHVLGIAIAAVLFAYASGCYKGLHSSEVTKVFWFTGMLTTAICISSKPGLEALCAVWNTIAGWLNALPGPGWKRFSGLDDKKWFITVDVALRLFAFIDMIGLGFCISNTGGEVSIYVPFLFTIPTVVALVEICRLAEVLFWWALSLATFSLALHPTTGFGVTDPDLHHRYLIFATGVCTLFPYLFIQTSRGQTLCPICKGTGKITAQTPIGNT